jgi:pyruvate dehydrogenase (quinone)
MSRTVADVIVETLESAGVKRCYGVPGDTLNYVTDAIRRSSIRWVHVRHEEAGGFAAGADALLTGEIAACAGSCGPGSLHFINGLFESHRNRAPVVLIASQIVRDELGFDFPQEVDYKSVYATCSVFCDEVRTPTQARRKTALAAQAALSKRGVAVLIVPADVSQSKAPDEPLFSAHKSQPVIRPADTEVQRIADAINGGGCVAIYGGSGCQHAHDQVVALAAKLRAPVAHTSRAKDFIEHDNPYNVGMTGVFGSEAGYHALMECSTLLFLGCDFAWRQFYPSDATIIQIDIDGTHLGRRHPVSIGAVGDIAATLDVLLPLVEERGDRSFLDECLERHRLAVARVWCLRHIPSTGQNRTILSLTHGTMANAMPQALGAKAAFPDRQVISLSGDGGIAVGDAIGLWGRHVERAEDLDDAVQEWLACPGPALLDAVTSRFELVMPPKIVPAMMFGTALYSVKAILSGRGDDLVEAVKDNLIK